MSTSGDSTETGQLFDRLHRAVRRCDNFRGLHMFNCDDVIQLLTDYVDGELEPDAHHQLESHFGACPACDSFLKSFRKTIDLTGQFRCEDIPEDVSRRLHDFLAQQIRDLDSGPAR